MARPAARHRTRVDRWLMVTILAGYAVGIGISGLVMSGGGRLQILTGLTTLILVLLPLPLLYPVQYVLTDRELVARSGILRWRIPIPAIDRVLPTRNPLAGPALSLHRLEVRFQTPYGPGFIRISPLDRTAFLRDLCARDAGLRIVDGMVVRNAMER